jgi:Na+-transporting NADH:ubiquinone oxidoreductase subunit C
VNESPLRSLGVLAAVALVCAVLVSVSVLSLRPYQERNQLLQRNRHVVAMTGLVEAGADDETVLEVVSRLDVRVVDLKTGEFATDLAPEAIDSRSAASDPERSTALPPAEDLARLGRRANHEIVYLVWDEQELSRVILPISGQGMWSTLYGYIALEKDLNTIAATRFYEQGETAGLGDQIENPAWQAQWQGRKLFDDRGSVQFRVASGSVDPTAVSAAYEVDGLTGATVTGNAVANLVRFWFGPSGYGPLLAWIAEQPPER